MGCCELCKPAICEPFIPLTWGTSELMHVSVCRYYFHMLSLKNGWLILGHTPAARPGLSVFVFSRGGEIALISSERRGEKTQRDGAEERK